MRTFSLCLAVQWRYRLLDDSCSQQGSEFSPVCMTGIPLSLFTFAARRIPAI
jgi:hypothetical protein